MGVGRLLDDVGGGVLSLLILIVKPTLDPHP